MRFAKVMLSHSEAGVLASLAEMTLDGSDLTFHDWIEVNANKERTLTRALNKLNIAYGETKG